MEGSNRLAKRLRHDPLLSFLWHLALSAIIYLCLWDCADSQWPSLAGTAFLSFAHMLAFRIVHAMYSVTDKDLPDVDLQFQVPRDIEFLLAVVLVFRLNYSASHPLSPAATFLTACMASVLGLFLYLVIHYVRCGLYKFKNPCR
jgi:hypothetical protein